MEIDLSKPLLAKYRLENRIYRIEYVGLHNICFNCGIYGHSKELCPKLAEGTNKDNNKEDIVNASVNKNDRPEVLEQFGPWMMAKKNVL